MDGPKVGGSSAVRTAAQALRAISLRTKEGALLGSEDEIVARMGVSRPTLRQAASLVVQEQLLSVRRGVGGGYFAARPDSAAVAHMAAIYLQIHEATLEDILRAVAPIRVELARMAAQNRDAPALAHLSAFLERERELDSAQITYRAFLKSEREFGALLAALANNKVLALFAEILYDFAGMVGRENDVYLNRPDRIESYRSKRNRLVEVIIEGDEQVAGLAALRCTSSVMEWVMEDEARSAAFSPPSISGKRNAPKRKNAR